MRHLVEDPQPVEHRQADALARPSPPPRAQALDLAREGLELVDRHRTALRRGEHAVDDLRPLERRPLARALDHDERRFLESFERREPAATREALSPSPDRRAVVSGARVDHLVIERRAGGATHHRDGMVSPRSHGKLSPGCSGGMVASSVDQRPHVAVGLPARAIVHMVSPGCTTTAGRGR